MSGSRVLEPCLSGWQEGQSLDIRPGDTPADAHCRAPRDRQRATRITGRALLQQRTRAACSAICSSDGLQR